MAVRLNASGDILYRTANLPGFAAYTLAAWFYRVNAQAGSFIYPLSLENTAYPTDASQYNVLGIDTAGTLHVTNSGAATNFSATPAVGTWFYAYMRGNGTNLQGGWAAATAAAFTTVSQSQGNVFTPANLAFGSDTFDEFLDGRVAYPRVWDAALTDAELLAEMRSPIPVRWANLNLGPRLLTDTDFNDKTSNARNFTVGGSITSEDGPPIRGYPRRGNAQPRRVATANSYTLTAASGSYTLTGQTVALKAGRRLACAAGSYTLTGSVALVDTALTATPGSYSLTGQAVGLRASRRLAAVQGSYTLSGQSIAMIHGYVMPIGQGTYTLTGQTISLSGPQKVLTLEAGDYDLTGQALGLKAARRLSAGQGSYQLNGQDVDLHVPGAFSLTAAAGSYSLTGEPTGLGATRRMSLAAGSYEFTGSDAAIRHAAMLTCVRGLYHLDGQSIQMTSSGTVLLPPQAKASLRVTPRLRSKRTN